MTAAAPQPDRTLYNRNFILWWLGSAQSSLGSALSSIALSFLVLEQTGSAGAMGFNLALSLLPGLLTPLAGTLVDRVPIKVPLILSDLLRGLIIVGIGLWALQGDVPLLALNALALAMGLLGSLYQPAAGAVLPQLVRPQQLPRANGLIGTASQTASLVGLVGGGLLVNHLGSAPALLIDGATFIIMAGLLTLVRLPARPASTRKRSFWADFRAGLARMRASRILMLIPVFSFFLNASFAPIMMLLPKRMLDLGAGAAGYGTFLALLTAGIALGSAAYAAYGQRVPARVAVSAGLLGMAAALGGMAFAQAPVTYWALALAMGLFNAWINTPIMVLMQTIVEAEFRGRVFSFLGMVGQIGMPLTLLLLAPVADTLPISGVFITAALAGVLGAAAWAAISREQTTVARTA